MDEGIKNGAPPHREGLGSEHKFNDALQLILFIGFFIVWGLDSFYWHTTHFLNNMVPWWIRIIFFLMAISFCVYLVKVSWRIIFTGDHTGKVVRDEVYNIIRHPMYMGEIMLYVAFFFLTLSLVSFIYIIGTWIIIDRMASFEEKEMELRLGDQYRQYKMEVGKWIPKRMRMNYD